jgi:hypothetical protein
MHLIMIPRRKRHCPVHVECLGSRHHALLRQQGVCDSAQRIAAQRTIFDLSPLLNLTPDLYLSGVSSIVGAQTALYERQANHERF